MFSFDGSITGDLLSMKLPTSADWHKLGFEEAKELRKRGQMDKVDLNGQKFKPYSEAYIEYLKEFHPKKSTTVVNLTLSGRMFQAVGSNIRATGDSVRITMSGEEGYKVWDNERMGREFFGLSEDRKKNLAEQFATLVIKGIS